MSAGAFSKLPLAQREAIKQSVASAPRLTEDRLARLAAILKGGGAGGD